MFTHTEQLENYLLSLGWGYLQGIRLTADLKVRLKLHVQKKKPLGSLVLKGKKIETNFVFSIRLRYTT